MQGRGGRLLVCGAVAAALILSSCGGSDDDATTSEQPAATSAVDAGGSVTTGAGTDGDTTPGDEDYCRVVRRTKGLPTDQLTSVYEQQVAVAPDELKGALDTLLDNVDVLQGYTTTATEEEKARIQQPLTDVFIYQLRRCGVNPLT